ncbi:DUF305 domain-containing protein [Nocardia paucivorans]|uniref:DUF305 domain-containing protein n=1 Tax=Nocardia paucivorans TaxID=114259 RepID=UPI0002D2CE2A|nr:DUF305 domain-containing protein [Nocardia paucivorans]
MSRKILISVVPAALACVAVLTGCGDDGSTGHDRHPVTATSATPDTSAARTEKHNDADIAFAQEMIPHHRQAIEMAALVPSRSTDPRILDLANRIRAAQEPEITTMTTWLRSWGVAAPPTDEHDGMDHGDTPMMPGMMTDEQMDRLEAATGAEFDRLWLTGMIAHHRGAVDMARTELTEGSNPEAEDLARQIIETQQDEITRMQSLLQG